MEYTMKEFAHLKRVSYRTVQEWVKKGLVKTKARPSGRYMIVETPEEENLK